MNTQSLRWWARFVNVVVHRPAWLPYKLLSNFLRSPHRTLAPTPRLRQPATTATPVHLYIPARIAAQWVAEFEIGPFGECAGLTAVTLVHLDHNGISLQSALSQLFRHQISFRKRNGMTEIERIGSLESDDEYRWFVCVDDASTTAILDLSTYTLKNSRVELWYGRETPTTFLLRV